MAECRSCHAEIRWARTVNGKRIPLDVNPDPAGNVTLDGDVATVHPKGQLPMGTAITGTYMPHHASCPHADDWRAMR